MELQNEIGTVILENHHNPIHFNHPPLKKGVTYKQLKKLVKDVEAKYNIKTKTTIDFILKELDKLQKIENNPVPYLKAFCRFNLTDQFGEYEGVPYIDNLSNDTKLSDDEIKKIKEKLTNDYPIIKIEDFKIPYTESELFEKKRRLIQILYFQIEQEKNKFRPLNIKYDGGNN